MIYKMTSIGLLGVLISTQSYALNQLTEAHLRVANTFLMLQDPEKMVQLVDQADSAIDQITQTQSDEESKTAEDHTARYQRVRNRWESRFKQNIGPATERYAQLADRQSEPELLKAATQYRQVALDAGAVKLSDMIEKNWLGTASIKAGLKASFQGAAPEFARQLAGEIAEKGGIIPFALQLRSSMKELKSQLNAAIEAKKSGRSLASHHPYTDECIRNLVIFALFVGGGIFLLTLGWTVVGIIVVAIAGVGVIANFIQIFSATDGAREAHRLQRIGIC